jgi:bacillopeptidase F
VRAANLKPRVALIPGQRYTLSVTTGITDLALKPASADSKTFRASTDEQETSLRATSTWRRSVAKAAYGKRFVSESRAGAAVSFPFRGRKIAWYTMTGPTQGIAKVYVDGVKKARVNNYSTGVAWHVARKVKGLSNTAHTLRIVVAGRKGAKAGTGTGVVVDAARVGTTLVANPRVSSSWRKARYSGASGGGYAVSRTAKSAATFTFRGTSVTWVTQTARTMGKAKVYVDGVLKAKVDNFSAKSRWNVRRAVTGLSDSVHTVKVVVLGKKRARATGTDVLVDRWLVG